MNATVTRIREATDPANEARDILEEKRGRLDYDAARQISEAAFAEELSFLPLSAAELVYGTAYDAGGAEEGAENWLAIFNEYEALMLLVRAVQLSAFQVEELPRGSAASEAADAKNPAAAVFGALRRSPDMAEEAARELLEVLYPTSVATLDLEARRSIFKYAYDRGSAESWSTVADYYETATAVGTLAKLPAAEREQARAVKRP
jgi:hypothetical protein